MRRTLVQLLQYSKVEYSLTDFGKTLLPALEALAEWGENIGETKGVKVAL